MFMFQFQVLTNFQNHILSLLRNKVPDTSDPQMKLHLMLLPKKKSEFN